MDASGSTQRPPFVSIYVGISLILLGALGLGACIYLLTIPSGSRNAGVPAFSASRLLLAALNLLAAGLFVLAGIRCLRRPADIARSTARLKHPAIWASLFLVSLLVLIILLLALFTPLEEIGLDAYSPFRERLRSDLVWFVTISLWVLVTAGIGYGNAMSLQENNAPGPSAATAEPVYVRVIQIVLAALFILAASVSLRSFPNPIWGGDTDDYLYLAEKSIFSPEFYAGPRPWTTGLLYKLLGADRSIEETAGEDLIIRDQPEAQAIVIAQTVIHALCWGFLAFMAASLVANRWLRLLTMGLVLAIGLSPAVNMWNRVLLSESLSLSLMVLEIAVWLWIVKGWAWHKAFILILVTLLWAFTRDSNALLVLGTAGLLLSAGLALKKQRASLIIGLIFIMIFVISSILSDIRNRWATPLANVIFQRVLTDEQDLAYFIAQGMPAGPEVMAMSGKWSCADDCAFFKEAKYAQFRDWLFKHGRGVYIRFLLAHPVSSLTAPFAHLWELAGSNLVSPEWPGYIPPVPAWLSDILYTRGIETLMVWAVLLLAGFALYFRAWKSSPALVVVLLLLLLAYPHAFIAYHGDAMGIDRHAIQFSVQMRLCLWLSAVFLLDWLGSRRELEKQQRSISGSNRL